MFETNSSKFKIDLLTRHESAKVVAVISFVSAFLVLFLFQPFGEVRHNFALIGLLRILSYATVSSLILMFFQLIVLEKIQRTTHTNGPIFWALWYSAVLIAIILGIFLLKNYWMDFSVFSFADLRVVAYRVISIAIVPLLVVIAFAYRKSVDTFSDQNLTLKSLDKNPDYLNLKLGDLVCIRSEDNYIEISYLADGKVRRKLLRNNLANLEASLQPPLLRVHRSCMINLVNVESARINSQGGTALMKSTGEAIRISRRSLDRFAQEWQRHCNSRD